MRFDPSNTPVYGEITQFNIYSTDELGNKIIIKDTKDFDFLKFGSGMVKLKGNEKVRFISTNNDPVIIIDDFVMDRQKKYWVEVGVNITNKLEVIVNEVIGDFNEVIGDFLVLEDKHIGQIKELEWKISDTHEKQSLIKQELEKLEGNFKLLQDEHHQLERDHKELIREREQLILDLKKVSEALQIKQQSLDIKENLLDELMNSMSWKITKIFRILAKKFRAK
ncbi:hypothetical protein D3C75_676280 [compost metagenome]